nr:hypothetical protein [uncultured Roseateles sp.]
MSRLESKHWIAMFLVAALAGWFGLPPAATGPGLVQAKREVWALVPLPIRADATTQAIQVATSPMWGVEAKPAATEAPFANTRWRLAGVYGAGRVGGALVLFEDESKPPQRLKVGERLPSGHVIEAVDGNQVCIRIEKKLYRFGVERRE